MIRLTKNAATKIRRALSLIRQWATEYEPARAAGVAVVVFQGLAVLGIKVGSLPTIVDTALGLIALAAVAVQTWYVRGKVSSPATVRRISSRHTR